jgi:D-alanyl-D-alanine carboxypeptidase (penicillin-binding protein 5/6)
MNYRTLIAAPVAILAACFAVSASAQTIETPARNAHIVDLSTGTVLLSKADEIPMPPASMSKLMTIYMVFDRLKKGTLSLEDKFLVSQKAWRKGGSKMFVRVGDRVSVSDLLRGIIVQSGNDACIVVAEAIGGTEEDFARMMTARGREIGLQDSTFANATGWPDPGQMMSARDLATLSRHLIADFPDLYKIFSEKEFTFSNIKQGNRNPLLYQNVGADGLKTGHTEEAGYGLTASAERDGRRIVMVLNGMDSIRQRSQESLRLIEWAFRTFEAYSFFKKGDEVTTASVWLGKEKSVPLLIQEDLRLTLRRNTRDKMTVKVRLTEPVPAPIAEGTQLATLVLTGPAMKTVEIPLVAGANVEKLGFVGRIGAAVKHVIWGPS